MFSQSLPIAALDTAYPEQILPKVGRLDRAAARLAGPVIRALRARRLRKGRFLARVAARGREIEPLADSALATVAGDLRIALRRHGFQEELVARSFALIREVAGRTLGQRHFDVQLLGGWALLNGCVAEMETGEGKTLTGTLAASTAAFAGMPVHVVTVNDYLAARDTEWMGPVYRALGLSVGVVIHGKEPPARRAAYACDITYCSNKELVFDYLRDRLVLGREPNRIQLQVERLSGEQARLNRLLLRGLYYAIVDEADGVLIDEARTPLVLAGAETSTLQLVTYRTALSLAEALQPGHDFILNGRERTIRLTEAGRAKIEELAATLGGVGTVRRRREELITQALVARHLFHRDRQYLVRDQKVQIIDEYTGRILEGRTWEQGLHQMIEAKEGCPLTTPQASLARLTYQRFFRRYLRLAGMTGTAREVAGELWSVYRLPVVKIPTNRPLNRRSWGTRVFATEHAKWEAVLARVQRLYEEGRPVLIGTRSVLASEHLSQKLAATGLAHQVLNARQDQQEAEIIAGAGAPGRITLATNMAGRGTDIRLAPGVAAHGGLHVVATERHEARRIDRQLFGRCGRQGDPGSYEAIVSLQDELVLTYGSSLCRWLGRVFARAVEPLPRWIGNLLFAQAQQAAERQHAATRRELLRHDEQLESALSFSGRHE